jgi:hypothetical protein
VKDSQHNFTDKYQNNFTIKKGELQTDGKYETFLTFTEIYYEVGCAKSMECVLITTHGASIPIWKSAVINFDPLLVFFRLEMSEELEI